MRLALASMLLLASFLPAASAQFQCSALGVGLPEDPDETGAALCVANSAAAGVLLVTRPSPLGTMTCAVPVVMDQPQPAVACVEARSDGSYAAYAAGSELACNPWGDMAQPLYVGCYADLADLPRVGAEVFCTAETPPFCGPGVYVGEGIDQLVAGAGLAAAPEVVCARLYTSLPPVGVQQVCATPVLETGPVACLGAELFVTGQVERACLMVEVDLESQVCVGLVRNGAPVPPTVCAFL